MFAKYNMTDLLHMWPSSRPSASWPPKAPLSACWAWASEQASSYSWNFRITKLSESQDLLKFQRAQSLMFRCWRWPQLEHGRRGRNVAGKRARGGQDQSVSWL